MLIDRYSLDDLFFLSSQSHPISDPNDTELILYTEAAKELSNQKNRLAVVDHSAIFNEAVYLSNSWYNDSVSDKNHLAQIGYRGKWEGLIDQIATIYPS